MLHLFKSLRQVSTDLLTAAEHLYTEESVAVEALLFDPQLPVDAAQAIKFGAVRTYMGLVDEVFANWAS